MQPIKIIPRLQLLAQHRLTRSTIVLQFGSTGAMLVQAVANIILARMFGAEQFGIYAIAFSVAATASIVLGAGAVDALAPAATRAWHDEDAKEMTGIVAYLLKFSCAAGLIALLVFVMLPIITGHIYHDRSIGLFAGAILMASLVSSLGLAIVNLGLQLSGRYTHLSLLTLADMSIRFACSILLVRIGLGVGGAMLGQLIGAAIVLFAVIAVWKNLSRAFPFWPSLRAVFAAIPSTRLRSRLAPTLWVLGDRNLAMLFGALPIAIAGVYLVATDVSYVKVALGYVMLAMSVIGPISVVLNIEFAKKLIQDPNSIRRMFIRVSLASLAMTASIMVVISLVAHRVIVLLYGSTFEPSVLVVYSLFLFGATLGAGAGLGPMWRALHRVRVSMLINGITLLIGIPVGILLVREYGGYGVGVMMTLWYVSSQFGSFLYILRELRKENSAFSKN